MALSQEQIAQIVATLKSNYKEELNKQLTAGAQLSAAVFISMLNQQLIMNNAMNAKDYTAVLSAAKDDADMGPFINANETKIAQASPKPEKQKDDVETQLKQIVLEIQQRAKQEIKETCEKYQKEVNQQFKDKGVLIEGDSEEAKAARQEQDNVFAGGATVLPQDAMERLDKMRDNLKATVKRSNEENDHYIEVKSNAALDVFGPGLISAALNPDFQAVAMDSLISDLASRLSHDVQGICNRAEIDFKTKAKEFMGPPKNPILRSLEMSFGAGLGTNLSKPRERVVQPSIIPGQAGRADIGVPKHPLNR